jgi:hypothetical protein
VDHCSPCTSESPGSFPGGAHMQLGLSSPCLHQWVFLPRNKIRHVYECVMPSIIAPSIIEAPAL